MLDAIAAIDNLGMEDSTLAADASPTSLETNPTMGESQGSSMQSTDFNQSLMDMLSSLDTPADVLNPSLQIVSGQSLDDALADAIPGLDPTTVTPPAPLAQDENLNPFMMAAITELDNPEALGKAFQTVSDGFEGLSDSFEQLAASFLSQDSNANPTAIDANAGDASTTPEVKNVAMGDAGEDADTSLDTDKMAIADVTSDTADTKVDKIAIANDPNTINADFGIGDMISNTKSSALGTDFNLDFSALKVNVDQVSRGLQFLVQQLEAAFECDDSAPTTLSTFNSSR
ncbi:MAG: hypothetical protein LH679_21995 [Cyanobacteria bacterium CAN_BIN43]|nr:hypothetical protein [Cyanobacteria bacterium CAN_BIN43]